MTPAATYEACHGPWCIYILKGEASCQKNVGCFRKMFVVPKLNQYTNELNQIPGPARKSDFFEMIVQDYNLIRN